MSGVALNLLLGKVSGFVTTEIMMVGRNTSLTCVEKIKLQMTTKMLRVSVVFCAE